MAKFIFDNAEVFVDGDDFSDHVRSVTITDESEEVDVTAMGANNRSILLGLGDATIEVEFYQDFAATEIHANLSVLKGSNTPFPVYVKPVKGTATSATNPEITMSEAVMPSYSPLAGAVGEASMVTATFRNAGQAGITYQLT